MARPYSQDLRDRVLTAYDRGMKTRQIALTFDVSPAWARRVKQRRRETGEITPRKMGSPGVRKIERDQLIELVKSTPDATLQELRERLDVPCSRSAISMILTRLGFTFKKNAARGGAGSSRCGRTSNGMARMVRNNRSPSPDLHR